MPLGRRGRALLALLTELRQVLAPGASFVGIKSSRERAMKVTAVGVYIAKRISSLRGMRDW
jgi:hypothetical protein